MKIIYIPSAEEVKSTLMLTGKLDSARNTVILRTILFLFGFSLFASAIVNNPSNGTYWVVAAVCIIFIPISWILRYFNIKSIINKSTDGSEFSVEFFENKLFFKTENGIGTEVLKTDIQKISQNKLIFALLTRQDSVFLIPKRVITQEQTLEIEEFFNGLEKGEN
ncbi:MAG: hypothetical protein PHV07_03605 [Oscillospiraceae bacterium]|nr:hypothetical protein [Oscillospiraceae bacterium]